MSRIIGFTGQMFAGKTAAIDGLTNALKRRMGVVNVKFAQPLYDIQADIYQRIGQPVPFPKDRKLLQWLGTEWGRSIDPNLWVNLWKRSVQEQLDMDDRTVVTCDDCRFDNEGETIKSLGGVIVRVVAPLELRQARAVKLGTELINTGHPSENGISDKYVDFTVCNDGSVKDMYDKMKALLETIGYEL